MDREEEGRRDPAAETPSGPEHAAEPEARTPWHRRRWAYIAGAVIAVLALLTAVLWQRCGLRGCPDVDELKGRMPDEASTVLDRNGDEIGKLYVTHRIAVPIDSIPEVVREAFIAIEDRRFREHGGVDWRRVLGAFWTNVRAMDIEEGSSTITMQLARNAFPDKLPANRQTIWRKLGEARVAKEIEERYSKDQILELYLNQIYFGSGAWGIEAAAQEYFGKHVWDLELSEAAMLAALPRAPSRFNPRANEEAALEGRSLVLARMAEQGRITAEEAEEAADAELELRRRDLTTGERAPYFLEAVRRVLEDQLGDALYTEGYVIRTTLDLSAQKQVEEALFAQLQRIESGAYGTFRHETYASVHEDSASLAHGTPYLQGAAVVMDARTGDVIALVGGRDFDDSQFNRATQALRQPGSAFKPFVYTAALQTGTPPTHRLMDEPVRLVLDDGRAWEPGNYDGSYSGAVTMRHALTHSKNVPTVRLAFEVGVPRVAALAERLLLQDMPTNPSMVLGTAEVTPLQLTAAYATYATLGQRPRPRFVTAVEDRTGRTVYAEPVVAEGLLDPALAFLTVSLLRDVVDRGTGWPVRSVGFRGAAGGKTGTTQDAADVWFVGFTPEYVGTVWMGFDRRQRIVRGATGGELAAPVWGRFMRQIAEPAEGWPVPAGIETRTVDEYGAVVADNCPLVGAATRTEYFLAGTVPAVDCWPDGYLTYADSLAMYADSTEEGWWQRMRERLFGEDEEERLRDSIRLDSLRRVADSLRARTRDTLILRSDTMRDTIGDTLRIRRDTVRDTLRRDTTRDTIRVPQRDTFQIPQRDTFRIPPRDTTVDTTGSQPMVLGRFR